MATRRCASPSISPYRGRSDAANLGSRGGVWSRESRSVHRRGAPQFLPREKRRSLRAIRQPPLQVSAFLTSDPVSSTGCGDERCHGASASWASRAERSPTPRRTGRGARFSGGRGKDPWAFRNAASSSRRQTGASSQAARFSCTVGLRFWNRYARLSRSGL